MLSAHLESSMVISPLSVSPLLSINRSHIHPINHEEREGDEKDTKDNGYRDHCIDRTFGNGRSCLVSMHQPLNGGH